MKTIEERIKELEELKFNIDMIDRWTIEESKRYDEVCEKIKELKQIKANES